MNLIFKKKNYETRPILGRLIQSVNIFSPESEINKRGHDMN